MAGIFDTGIFDTGIFDHDDGGVSPPPPPPVAEVTTGAHGRKRTRGEQLADFLREQEIVDAQRARAQRERAPEPQEARRGPPVVRAPKLADEPPRPAPELPATRSFDDVLAELRARSEAEAKAQRQAKAKRDAEARALAAAEAAAREAERKAREEDDERAIRFVASETEKRRRAVVKRLLEMLN